MDSFFLLNCEIHISLTYFISENSNIHGINIFQPPSNLEVAGTRLKNSIFKYEKIVDFRFEISFFEF